MNCREVQEKLLDHIEGTLENSSQEAMIHHLNHCKQCAQAKAELIILYQGIDDYSEKEPDPSLENDFQRMLSQEKSKLKEPVFLFMTKRKKQMIDVLKVAATILLVMCSYYFGEYNANRHHNKVSTMMKEEMIFSLMESKSASKRIQAVMYSKDLDHTNEKMLQAFIGILNNDRHLNVRLAAADALSNFTESKLVIDALIDRLIIEKNVNMQLELIQILIEIPDNRIIPVIKEIQENSETPSSLKNLIERQIELRI